MNKVRLLAVTGSLVAALVLAALAAACGGGEEEGDNGGQTGDGGGEGTEVEVRLLDHIEPGDTMAMELDSTTIPAGEITFVAVNQGQDEHELEVFPYIDGETGEDLGEVEEIAPGTSKSLTLDLEPGRYELACKIKEEEESGEVEDHYEMGMHIDITVQ